MMFSNEQAIYFKNYLTLKEQGDNISRLNNSLHESKITLNPHQINAALFFFKNPLNKGFIFADEVGLGKTIEAGLIISQYWYERKRKIIIVCPASLIKQWNEELYNKFHLDSQILDSKTIKNKNFKWDEKIYVTSMNSIYLNKDFFSVKFDLVVIDEAHKLRNVYQNKGVMAIAIKEIFYGQKKLLLTATPFQNNLMELYGLMSLLDKNIFPDEKVFKNKYIINYEENKNELYSILSHFIIRTLRKDVSKYINFTNRNVLLVNYYTTNEEKDFYDLVSDVLYGSDFTKAYSTGQNQLLTILLQKLLSSSIYAVLCTLIKMYSSLVEKKQLCIDDSENIFNIEYKNNISNITGLITNINKTINFSKNLKKDSKLEALIQTLKNTYDSFYREGNRNKKILIFTESKRTQEYLYNELQKNGYSSVLTFNGDNNNLITKKIYNNWLKKNPYSQNNKNANIRRAIIDAFENKFEILIATDSAAEGLNMQFCSIIINYDLPWNPQKIEQRIGRCHRYGQKNDVIVINLLNRSNSIDQRIYDLLSSKLGIFESTFGSSDMILGNDNLSNSIEESIREIYKKSRSPEEIELKFKELQEMYDKEIKDTIQKSENEMEKYFDEEVKRNFDLQFINARKTITEYEEILCNLIKYTYPNVDINENLCFSLNKINYSITNKYQDKIFVSPNTEFGKKIFEKNIPQQTKINGVIFKYDGSNTKIGFIDNLSKRNGLIFASKIVYDSFELTETIVLSGILYDGTIIPHEIIHKLLKLNTESKKLTLIKKYYDIIEKIHEQHIKEKLAKISEYNNRIFVNESEFIDCWADSMIEKVQFEVKQMREERRELQKQFDLSANIDEKATLQEKISKLSRKITKSWISLAHVEDEINDKRNLLITNLRSEKNKNVTCEKLFELEFEIK